MLPLWTPSPAVGTYMHLYLHIFARTLRQLGQYFTPFPKGLATLMITLLATRPEHTSRGGAVRRAATAHILSFTCTVDGLDHLVSDDAAALGIGARQGTYTAMCGHLIYAAALASSTGPVCPHCTQAVQHLQSPITVQPHHRRHRRARLGRLFGRHSTL